MEAFSAPFTGHLVLVLEPEEAKQLRDRLLVEFFAEKCIAREISKAIDRQLLGLTS